MLCTSARWPAKLLTAENVKVQMVHRLTAVLAIVHHDAEAILEALCTCNFASYEHQVAKQLRGLLQV